MFVTTAFESGTKDNDNLLSVLPNLGPKQMIRQYIIESCKIDPEKIVKIPHTSLPIRTPSWMLCLSYLSTIFITSKGELVIACQNNNCICVLEQKTLKIIQKIEYFIKINEEKVVDHIMPNYKFESNSKKKREVLKLGCFTIDANDNIISAWYYNGKCYIIIHNFRKIK